MTRLSSDWPFAYESDRRRCYCIIEDEKRRPVIGAQAGVA